MQYTEHHRHLSARCLLTVFVSISLVGVTQAQSFNPFKGKSAKIPAMKGIAPASFNTPRVNMPQANMPRVNMPQVSMPQVNMPRMPQANMPQLRMPQLKMPQMNMPQAKMPQMGMPQLKMPQINAPKFPQLNGLNGQMPQNPFASVANAFQPQQRTGLGGMVDKWNQSTKSFLDKTRQALTIPSLKSPTASTGGLRSLLPGLTQQQAPAQPPTLTEWFGQPRPQ